MPRWLLFHVHNLRKKRQKGLLFAIGNLHSTSFYCWPHNLSLPTMYPCFDLWSCEFKILSNLWPKAISVFLLRTEAPFVPESSFISPPAPALQPSIWQSDKWARCLWHISPCGEYTRYEGAVTPGTGALLESLKVLSFPVGYWFQEVTHSRVRTKIHKISCLQNSQKEPISFSKGKENID